MMLLLLHYYSGWWWIWVTWPRFNWFLQGICFPQHLASLRHESWRLPWQEAEANVLNWTSNCMPSLLNLLLSFLVLVSTCTCSQLDSTNGNWHVHNCWTLLVFIKDVLVDWRSQTQNNLKIYFSKTGVLCIIYITWHGMDWEAQIEGQVKEASTAC
jgi:hypothetical protein